MNPCDIACKKTSQKEQAMLLLMCELNTGIRSGNKEGWVNAAEVRARFDAK